MLTIHGYNMMYNTNLNLYEGELGFEEYSCSFFYEVKRNGEVRFYLNQNIATPKLINLEFRLENKQEYEAKVKELEYVINEYSLSKEGKEFASYLQKFIEKVEGLRTNKQMKDVSIVAETMDGKSVYVCHCIMEDIHFKFQKSGKRIDVSLHYPYFKENSEGGLDYYRVWHSENIFNSMFSSTYWEEIRKKSKYRLRFLQTINE